MYRLPIDPATTKRRIAGGAPQDAAPGRAFNGGMAVRQTRTQRRGRARAALVLTPLLLVPCALAAAPPPQPPPQLTASDVDLALGRLDGIVRDGMRRTGVPGVAVAVVRHDKVVYLKGFGVRRRRARPARIDPDTVFQLASLSKPLASTVVAGAVGRQDRRLGRPGGSSTSPASPCKDPWVTRHVTVADLFSHRSGLPDHAGDLLEDLGYDRAYILDHLRHEPLAPFRAELRLHQLRAHRGRRSAVAEAHGHDLGEARPTTPSTSRRHGLHQLPLRRLREGRQQPRRPACARRRRHLAGRSTCATPTPSPRPAAPAPRPATWPVAAPAAGDGTLDGQADHRRRRPRADPPPADRVQPAAAPAPAAPASTGSAGTSSYDDHGRLRLSHSGAFALGATPTSRCSRARSSASSSSPTAPRSACPRRDRPDFFDTAEHGKPDRRLADLLGEALRRRTRQRDAPPPTTPSRPPTPPRPATAPTPAPTPTPTTAR